MIPAGSICTRGPAGQLVRAAAAQDTRIVLRSNGREADAASILQVLALGATGGTPIVVEASGEAARPRRRRDRRPTRLAQPEHVVERGARDARDLLGSSSPTAPRRSRRARARA